MTEYEAWTLMAAFFTSNAVFFLGCIVAVWLGFRMSNNIFDWGSPLAPPFNAPPRPVKHKQTR